MANGDLSKAIAEDMVKSEILAANAEVAKVRAENASLRGQLKAALAETQNLAHGSGPVLRADHGPPPTGKILPLSINSA